MKNQTPVILAIVICRLLSLPLSSAADTSFTVNNTTADAFLAAGSPGNPVGTNLTSLNFGGVGTLAIAPASTTKGEFDSVIKFNLGSAVSQFNTTYGAGYWHITGLTLSLASNFGGQGEQPGNNLFNSINAGSFGISWLSNDGWVEGNGGGAGGTGFPNNTSVSFNSIPNLLSGPHDSLGTFTYTPPGDNIYANYTLPLDANLVADATAGGDVSLYFNAADTQVSYLFNARNFASGHPELTLQVVPEPGSMALLAISLGGLLMARKRKI